LVVEGLQLLSKDLKETTEVTQFFRPLLLQAVVVEEAVTYLFQTISMEILVVLVVVLLMPLQGVLETHLAHRHLRETTEEMQPLVKRLIIPAQVVVALVLLEETQPLQQQETVVLELHLLLVVPL
jgi:hypothetical protein